MSQQTKCSLCLPLPVFTLPQVVLDSLSLILEPLVQYIFLLFIHKFFFSYTIFFLHSCSHISLCFSERISIYPRLSLVLCNYFYPSKASSALSARIPIIPRFSQLSLEGFLSSQGSLQPFNKYSWHTASSYTKFYPTTSL